MDRFSLLEHPSDILTASVVLIVFANFSALWLRPGVSVFHMAVSLAACMAVAAICHNHCHVPLWRHRPMNWLMDAWVTLFFGPCFSWYAIHIRSHHAYHNEPVRDVTSTAYGDEKTGIIAFARYLTVSFLPFIHCNVEFFRQLKRERKWKDYWYYQAHFVGSYALIAVLLVIDWRKTLITTVLPQQLALMTISVFNYCQHVKTRFDEPMEVSRNFTSRFFNAYVFNAGYHTVHHLKPTLHWSLMGREYAKVEKKIPDHLKEKSLAGFFYRAFLLGRQPSDEII